MHAFRSVGFLWVIVAVVPTSAAEPSITVTGSGKVSAKPDMAQVQLGVTTQAPTAAKALEDNDAAMEKLFAGLAEKGIDRKDVQTSSFRVGPVYTLGPQRQQTNEVTGYEVSNVVTVKVRKLDTLGEVLEEAVSEGANRVQGVSFTVAEPEPLLDQARRKAVADARRKAELYAKEAGVSVGRVLQIQEGPVHVPRPQVHAVAARAAAVPVAEREREFAASVTVTYSIATQQQAKGP